MPENEKKPKQALSAQLAGVGGIVLGLLGSFVIGPALFPRTPGQGFSIEQMICAGVCGALGAVVGWVIGAMIGGPPKAD
jgi:hypothetical protein